jgi:hypothetical protein
MSDRIFPKENRISHANFDDKHIHLHLTDGRILSIPLAWIPAAQAAKKADRFAYHVGSDGQTLTWLPDTIDADLRLLDYIGPTA